MISNLPAIISRAPLRGQHVRAFHCVSARDRNTRKKKSKRNANFAADGGYQKEHDLSFISFPDTRAQEEPETHTWQPGQFAKIAEHGSPKADEREGNIFETARYFAVSWPRETRPFETGDTIRLPELIRDAGNSSALIIYDAPVSCLSVLIFPISSRAAALGYNREPVRLYAPRSLARSFARKSCPSLFTRATRAVISHTGGSIIIAYERLSVIGECKHRVCNPLLRVSVYVNARASMCVRATCVPVTIAPNPFTIYARQNVRMIFRVIYAENFSAPPSFRPLNQSTSPRPPRRSVQRRLVSATNE